MAITRKKGTVALAAALSCLLAGYALAQQIAPAQTERPTPPGVEQPRTTQPSATQRDTFGGQRATTGNASSDVNRFLAACWEAKNKAEIELSQIAQQRAQNPQVKQFAQKMVQEHGQLSQKLQQLASGQPRGQSGATGAQSSRPGTQAATSGNQAINRLIEIDRQIAQRTSEMMRQKLEEEQGAKFDQCYIGGQIACHMQASAALGIVSQQASGELKQLASEAKQKVDRHLEEAERLAEQLAQSAPAGPQARTTRDPNLRPAGAEERR